MKFSAILLISLWFFNLSLLAQTEDPNSKVKAMSLTEKHIEYLCDAAIGEMPTRTDWELPAIMELMYGYEGKMYPDFPSKQEAHEWLAKMWDEKYSCVYCEITEAITGSLDMMSLYHENRRWVYGLYDPDGVFKAPINKIRVINDYLGVEGTLVDYLEYVAEIRPTRQVERDPSFKESLLGAKKRIIEYGGKRMSEMTPEEIERNKK